MDMFDRDRFLQNIQILAKRRKMKVGELEAKIGVLPGYLSRLSKNEKKTLPPIDVVVKIAEAFGVSVDDLTQLKYETLSDNENYYYEFISKLISDTQNGKLLWDSISVDYQNLFLNNFYPNCHLNRLFDMNLSTPSECILSSDFHKNINLFPDELFVTEIRPHSFIILVNCHGDIAIDTDPECPRRSDIEMFIDTSEKLEPLVNSLVGFKRNGNATISLYSSILNRLLTTIKKSGGIELSKNAKVLINEYMNDTD